MMSTASHRSIPLDPYSDRFLNAPTQPLPAARPGRRQPFVVTHAALRSKKSQAVVRAVARPKTPGRLIPLWLGFFALLNLGDILSTWAGLHSGMREGNPLMSTLLTHYGFAALIGYKLLVVLAVTAGVLLLRSFQLLVARVTIVVCNLLVLLVVALNLVQYLMS
jgi:hypothetical protein